MHTAYCSTCRERKEILEIEEGTDKNGRKLVKGKCASCGEELVKILNASGVGSGSDNEDSY